MDIGVGVDAEGGDLVLTALGTLVERLDVFEDVLEAVGAGIDGAAGEAVEHERVVGVGAVGQANAHRRSSPECGVRRRGSIPDIAGGRERQGPRIVLSAAGRAVRR